MSPIKRLLTLSSKQRKLCKRLEVERSRLFRMAYSWSHNTDVAEEVVQETMIKALKGVDRVKDDAALDGWVFRILSNSFIDYCRKQRNEVELDDATLIEVNTPESIQCQNEMLLAVRVAIATLPFKHRQVLTLIDIENFTYTEVAEIVDAPLGTIMSRLNRARQSLRQKLKEQALNLDCNAKVKATLKIVS